MAEDKGLRINEQIRIREIRLIDSDGTQQGIVPTREALAMAQNQGLDLVEVSPLADPPVCKILDYGKYRFELEKKLRDSKKKQKVLKLKEIRMQPKIAGGDIEVKSKHIKDFLAEGNKVKVTVRFRGRELAHTELGLEILNKVLNLLEDEYIMERQPVMEGRFMTMTIGPKVKK